MTEKQLHILQHSLGLDQYGLADYYHEGRAFYGFMPNRNRFCAGGADEDLCRELVALGYMQQHRTTEMLPYFNCSVTDTGKDAVRRESPAPPKMTRSKQRYRDYMKADTGFSFREYLEMLKRRNAGVQP